MQKYVVTFLDDAGKDVDQVQCISLDGVDAVIREGLFRFGQLPDVSVGIHVRKV